jgi:hypothetical protein
MMTSHSGQPNAVISARVVGKNPAGEWPGYLLALEKRGVAVCTPAIRPEFRV